MSTFMANKANIERKWYILDAAGKPLGKTAVRAADLLRGGVGRFPRREGRGGGTLEDVHRGCGSWSAKAAQYRNRSSAADANIGRFFLAAAATDF